MTAISVVLLVLYKDAESVLFQVLTWQESKHYSILLVEAIAKQNCYGYPKCPFEYRYRLMPSICRYRSRALRVVKSIL